jgi:hypothetical protein
MVTVVKYETDPRKVRGDVSPGRVDGIKNLR